MTLELVMGASLEGEGSVHASVGDLSLFQLGISSLFWLHHPWLTLLEESKDWTTPSERVIFILPEPNSLEGIIL